LQLLNRVEFRAVRREVEDFHAAPVPPQKGAYEGPLPPCLIYLFRTAAGALHPFREIHHGLRGKGDERDLLESNPMFPLTR